MSAWFLIVVAFPFAFATIAVGWGAVAEFIEIFTAKKQKRINREKAMDTYNAYPVLDKDREQNERMKAQYYYLALTASESITDHAVASFWLTISTILCGAVVYWDWTYLQPLIQPYFKLLS